jgi:hypothetical protein
MNPAYARYGSRAAALLLPILLLGLLWAVAVAPLLAMSDGFASQRDQLLAQIAADRRQIALAPAYRDILSRLQAVQSPGARTETTQDLAAAGLQNDVQQIVAAAGGQIVSVQPLPPAQQNGFQTVAMQVTLSVPVGQLAGLIQNIETHTPYMFIDAASLQAPDAMSDQPPGPASAVTLLCTVTAYRRP